MTQGPTRKEALAMNADWFTSMANRKEFSVDLREVGKFFLEWTGCPPHHDQPSIVETRQKIGLTLAQGAHRLDSKSRNASARDEQGVSTPTVENLINCFAPLRRIGRSSFATMMQHEEARCSLGNPPNQGLAPAAAMRSTQAAGCCEKSRFISQ